MTAFANHMTHSETLAETALLQSRKSSPKKVRGLFRGIAILATACAMTLSTATPSLADRESDTLAKIIVGGLIVGAIVNDMKHKNGDRPRYDDEDYGYYNGRQPRLPRDCAVTIDSRDSGPVTLYGGRCLRDYGFRDLPRCGRSVTIYGERDKLYSSECLRRAGFRNPSRFPRSGDRD